MMEALRVMTYFKVSLSTCNWDSAKKKPTVMQWANHNHITPGVADD